MKIFKIRLIYGWILWRLHTEHMNSQLELKVTIYYKCRLLLERSNAKKKTFLDQPVTHDMRELDLIHIFISYIRNLYWNLFEYDGASCDSDTQL